MGRTKKLVYLPLYTKDFTGDERLRMCSPSAWGIYIYLLCLLNNAPVRGAYKMSLLERRPDLKKSLTQRILGATTVTQKLHPFAEILQRQMPWKKTEILRGLKELLFYGAITIEGDAIIQKRMFKEGGNSLTTEENSVEEDTEKGTEKGANKSTEKSTKKSTKKNDFSSREHAHAHSEIEIENINNSNGIVIEGEKNAKKEVKNKKKTKENAETSTYTFDEFWADYDKQVGEDVCRTLFERLSGADKEAIRAYIPKYKQAQTNKRFRKNPETFLSACGWKDEIIEEYGGRKKKVTADTDGVVRQETAEPKPGKKYTSTL